MNNIWILAQEQGQEQPFAITSEPATEQTETTVVVPDSNAPAPAVPAKRPTGYYNLILLGLMFVIMYFLLFRGPRKKQQQHQRMVQSLQKNDRIQTIGGIIGTVIDIKDDEITLKVDESNNTKIKIVPSAIGKRFSKD